ncbi:MAG: hypothetical protein EPN98_12665 [Phenylobacterium sp.]|nr:MAG: hypothetical protein EPN98_12665 [Phenylobacterium sp.]
MAEARTMIERWRLDYHHVRPHPAHGGLTPGAVRLNPPASRCATSKAPPPSRYRRRWRSTANPKGLPQ